MEMKGFKNRDETTLIRISKENRDKIKVLADKKGLKQVTILEYLLQGKILISDL